MTLINSMIRTGRFFDFSLEMIKIQNEEKEEGTLWEFYLHRVLDKSFEEFKNSINQQNQEIDTDKILITINDSKKMLKDFKIDP